MAKIPLKKVQHYSDKVQMYLREYLQEPLVEFRKTDNKVIFQNPTVKYTQKFTVNEYWEKFYGQHPGYVAQRIIEDYLPPYAKTNYKAPSPAWNAKDPETKKKLKPANGYLQQAGMYTWTDSGKPWAVSGHNVAADLDYAKKYFTSKSQMHSYGAMYDSLLLYGQSSNSDVAPKNPSYSINVDMNIQQIKTTFESLAKAMQQVGGEMAKLGKALGPVIAEANKQYAATMPPQYSVLGHPGLQQKQGCPQPDCDCDYSLEMLIQHLNDDHMWKREAIADWLDTLDEQPIFYPDIEFETQGD